MRRGREAERALGKIMRREKGGREEIKGKERKNE